MDLDFRMHAERTPNPNSIKWVLGRSLEPEGISANFQEPVTEEVSPLAFALFNVSGVTGVFLAGSFITVSKRDDVEWIDIAQSVVDAIKNFVETGEPAVGVAFVSSSRTDQGELVGRIREILEKEVRPTVAMDGGDVVFVGYKDGVVSVQLQGACVGCPSSTATLRFGIEARLREEIPEVEKVVSI